MLTAEHIIGKALPILIGHGVKRAGLFGSFAVGDAHADSDVDLLVEPADGESLLGMLQLKLDLEDVLERSVDLVNYRAIKTAIRDRILAEEIRFHG